VQLLWRSGKGKNYMHIVDEEKEAFCSLRVFCILLCAPRKFGGEFIATAVLHIKRTLEFIYSPMVNHPRNTTHISLVCCSRDTFKSSSRQSALRLYQSDPGA
jgi:hypothetical protein